jgi:hypothetical protein
MSQLPTERRIRHAEVCAFGVLAEVDADALEEGGCLCSYRRNLDQKNALQTCHGSEGILANHGLSLSLSHRLAPKQAFLNEKEADLQNYWATLRRRCVRPNPAKARPNSAKEPGSGTVNAILPSRLV